MRCILFCENNYAFGIMEPIKDYLENNGHDYIWYVNEKIVNNFPFKNEPKTVSILDLKQFNTDVIFVPGNEVPYYLKGLKVQIFHGLAGEKKGHFRIRHYFDLYLTQGPYFTRKFLELKQKYKNFDVIETGWPKLDIYGKELNKYDSEKKILLAEHYANTIVLYAPTFSPSLTSAEFLIDEFKQLAIHQKEYLILVKFHDLMAPQLIEAYKELSRKHENIIFAEEKNIIKFLLMADIMVSDTSSVVYEFLLLNKPVITFKSSSKNIQWDNSLDYKNLGEKIKLNLEKDPYKNERHKIVQEYHPYLDGNSAKRMVETVSSYIAENGVPEKRKLGFLRRLKIHKMYGKIKC